MKTKTEFLAQFAFREDGSGLIGVERERFLVDGLGCPIALSKGFLREVNNPRWTYELSACQVEDRTDPKRLREEILAELALNDLAGEEAAKRIGCELRIMEVAPVAMPLTVYPDPRYFEIAKRISEEELRAACRVAGVHIHYGVANMAEALRVYNRLRAHLGYLSHIGDCSHGERLALYRTMAPKSIPPRYKNEDDFYKTACERGFAENPRDCWHLIRISRHGTVECRMFGACETQRVMHLVDVVRRIVEGGRCCYETTW
ncbi:MAG: glutamate-cysteine ligase family protein [Patescibacteria group bacterium]